MGRRRSTCGAVRRLVWLGAEGEELVVHDMVLDSPARAGDLLPALVERARRLGARMLGIGRAGRGPVREALGSLPGFTVRATNMALALDGVIADPAPVTLRPMSQTEFDVWVEGEVEGYAEELAATGMSAERALERSRTQMAELIPAGLESPGHGVLHWPGSSDEVVGDLWLRHQPTHGVRLQHRGRRGAPRRGYGAAIMNAARPALPRRRPSLSRAERVRPQPERARALRQARVTA